MIHLFTRLALAAVLLALLPIAASAADLEPDAYHPSRILVKFQPGTATEMRAVVHAQMGGERIRGFRLDPDLELVRLPEGLDVGVAVGLYQSLGEVRYAEPDHIVHVIGIPNDARFNELWGMHNTGQSGGAFDFDIDAPEGWDINTDAGAIVIAGIDTGVDLDHEDLMANIWTNPGEIAGNGIDDDNNGYIDDMHGWDWIFNDNDPIDDHNHGSHTMGTAAAVGNNGIGVAGAAWSARIMALKICNSAGSCFISDAIEATDYATENGARLSSNSWGGGGFNQAMKDAITRADNAGVLYIAAAGNNGRNTDTSPFYPASYDNANIISVANMTRYGSRSSSSNYGATSVDLGAPGTSIVSTFRANNYGTMSGTSMACPHVAGVVTNVMGFNPTLGHMEYKDIIMQSVVPNDDMNGRSITGGVLNLKQALDNTPPVNVPPENDPPVADAGGPYKGRAYNPTLFDGSGSWDPDESELGDYVSTYVWDFGDGSVVSTSSPTITHKYPFGNQDYTVTLTVKDKYRVSSAPVTTICKIRGGGRKAK